RPSCALLLRPPCEPFPVRPFSEPLRRPSSSFLPPRPSCARRFPPDASALRPCVRPRPFEPPRPSFVPRPCAASAAPFPPRGRRSSAPRRRSSAGSGSRPCSWTSARRRSPLPRDARGAGRAWRRSSRTVDRKAPDASRPHPAPARTTAFRGTAPLGASGSLGNQTDIGDAGLLQPAHHRHDRAVVHGLVTAHVHLDLLALATVLGQDAAHRGHQLVQRHRRLALAGLFGLHFLAHVPVVG